MLTLQSLIDGVLDDLRSQLGQGSVADYIPELATVNPNKLAIATTTLDCETVSAGDAHEPFSIQSLSKVFSLTMTLRKVGDNLWERVGREPLGTALNSIVQLFLGQS